MAISKKTQSLIDAANANRQRKIDTDPQYALNRSYGSDYGSNFYKEGIKKYSPDVIKNVISNTKEKDYKNYLQSVYEDSYAVDILSKMQNAPTNYEDAFNYTNSLKNKTSFSTGTRGNFYDYKSPELDDAEKIESYFARQKQRQIKQTNRSKNDILSDLDNYAQFLVNDGSYKGTYVSISDQMKNGTAFLDWASDLSKHIKIKDGADKQKYDDLMAELGSAMARDAQTKEVTDWDKFWAPGSSFLSGIEKGADGIKEAFTGRQMLTDSDFLYSPRDVRAYTVREQQSGIGKFATDVAGGIGNMVPSIVANMFVPGSGIPVMMTNVYGRTYKELRIAGYTDSQAMTRALMAALIEGATEKLLGATFSKSGGFINRLLGDSAATLSKTLTSIFESPVIKNFLIPVLEEGAEEYVSDVLNEAMDRVILNTQNKSRLFLDPEYFYEALVGAISGAVTSAPTQISSRSQGIQYGVPSIPKTENTDSDFSMPKIVVQAATEINSESFDPEKGTYNNYLKKLPKEEGVRLRSAFNETLQKSGLLTKETKDLFKSPNDVYYYSAVTDADSLSEANQRLKKDKNSVENWLALDPKNATKADIAQGLILLDRYQRQGNYEMVANIIDKMARMGTNAGQVVQAFTMFSRLTPEGMLKYAQTELNKAFDQVSKRKNDSWKEANKSKFKLDADDIAYINSRMNELKKFAPNSRPANILLAQVQKKINSKIPVPVLRQIKSFARNSMLLNPKTMARNFISEAAMLPINSIVDLISVPVDRLTARKTGQGTSSGINIRASLKGAKTGVVESIQDFGLGINTKDMGDKFDRGRGLSFSPKTKLGRALNAVDNFTNFALDIGDRPFYEMYFQNALEGFKKANKTDTITAEMVEAAAQIANERTFQDDNAFTRTTLRLRNILNGNKEYGLGSMLMPFIKTPTNLIKAVMEYSPLGLAKALAVDARRLNTEVKNGKATLQTQKKFVEKLSRGIAGTLIATTAYILMEAGVIEITGAGDEDKDLANFERNIEGKQPYSIKIGDKWYSYNWMQPVGTTLAVIADVKKNLDEGKGANIFKSAGKETLNAVINALSTGGNVIFEQSFLKGIQTLMKEDGLVQGLIEVVLETPTQFVPTIFSQFAALVDDKQRSSFVYGDPLKTTFNKIKAKIPFLSKTLPEVVDSSGEVVLRYNGKNNFWNVFLNPATISSSNPSPESDEIYRVYKASGDKSIIPRVAPYYVDYGGERYILTPEQRVEWQKKAGKGVKKEVTKLLNSTYYKNLSDDEKAEVLNEVVNYHYNITKQYYMDHDAYGAPEYKLSATYQKIKDAENMGFGAGDYIIWRKYIGGLNAKNESGVSISGLKKSRVFTYINSLNLSRGQKTLLFAQNGYKITNAGDRKALRDYINSLDIPQSQKQELLKEYLD